MFSHFAIRLAVTLGTGLALGAGLAVAEEPLSLQGYMALHGPQPSARIAYGRAPSQYVELFEPAGAGPFPVVVLIHGGCFAKEFEGIPQMRGMAGALAAQGVAVWSIEYRRLDEPGGGYPGTFQDVQAALGLLVQQASGDRLDPAHLVVVGHSVGGYLALWLAGAGRLPQSSVLHQQHPLALKHVISLGSGGDMRPLSAHGRTACGFELSQLTGPPDVTRPDVYADTTASALLPNGSRTLLITGEFDSYCPPSQLAQYAAVVRRAGDAVDTLIVPNASHYDEVATTSPAWRAVSDAIHRALEEHESSPEASP